MLSVHFNGEMVRHYDREIIMRQHQERNEAEGRCKYGLSEIKCAVYINDAVNRVKRTGCKSGACLLSKSDLCPCRKKRVQSGKEDKTYTLDWKTYRKISSAAHWMIKESKFRTLFLTLTFPAYKHEQFDRCKNKFCQKVFEDEINKCFSKFAENLRSHYQCQYYVGVKERGKDTNRPHFHLLASFPFADFRKLNRAWLLAIRDISERSNHALFTDKKARFIRSPQAAVRYVCKYFNKSFGVTNCTRVIFMSNNVIIPPFKIHEEQGMTRIPQLHSVKYSFKKYEYVTVFKVKNDAEFGKFCNLFLYPLFECSIKNRNFYYVPT